jgi:hypothetical protein
MRRLLPRKLPEGKRLVSSFWPLVARGLPVARDAAARLKRPVAMKSSESCQLPVASPSAAMIASEISQLPVDGCPKTVRAPISGMSGWSFGSPGGSPSEDRATSFSTGGSPAGASDAGLVAWPTGRRLVEQAESIPSLGDLDGPVERDAAHELARAAARPGDFHRVDRPGLPQADGWRHRVVAETRTTRDQGVHGARAVRARQFHSDPSAVAFGPRRRPSSGSPMTRTPSVHPRRDDPATRTLASTSGPSAIEENVAEAAETYPPPAGALSGRGRRIARNRAFDDQGVGTTMFTDPSPSNVSSSQWGCLTERPSGRPRAAVFTTLTCLRACVISSVRLHLGVGAHARHFFAQDFRAEHEGA